MYWYLSLRKSIGRKVQKASHIALLVVPATEKNRLCNGFLRAETYVSDDGPDQTFDESAVYPLISISHNLLGPSWPPPGELQGAFPLCFQDQWALLLNAVYYGNLAMTTCMAAEAARPVPLPIVSMASRATQPSDCTAFNGYSAAVQKEGVCSFHLMHNSTSPSLHLVHLPLIINLTGDTTLYNCL